MLRLTIACAGLVALAAPPAATDAASAPAAPNVAEIPAAVQPLVQKIAAAQVNSERYVVTNHAIGTEPKKVHGRRHTVTVRTATFTHGEASLSPLVGVSLQQGSLGPVRFIWIGSSVYVNGPELNGQHSGLWVKTKGVGTDGLFPFHESGASGEVNAGGTGPYAGLLDLLATAPAGGISIAGQAVVAGQQTTEILAQVSPIALVDGAPVSARGEERFEVFVTSAGVPVRVNSTEGSGENMVTQSTEVLAVNIPVSVKAPPKRNVIGIGHPNKLSQAGKHPRAVRRKRR
jgi:hypothetical protein